MIKILNLKNFVPFDTTPFDICLNGIIKAVNEYT